MLTLRFFLCFLTITLLGGCGSSDGRDIPRTSTTDYLVSVSLPETAEAAALPATVVSRTARDATTNDLTLDDFTIDRLISDSGEDAQYRLENLEITRLENLGDGRYRLTAKGEHRFNTLITVSIDNVEFKVLAIHEGTPAQPLTLDLRSSAAVTVFLANVGTGAISLDTITVEQISTVLVRLQNFIDSIDLPDGLVPEELLDYLGTQATHLCTVDGANADNTACETGYTVGGSVSNLLGTLVLSVNGGNLTTLSADGAFTLLALLSDGEAYSVSVASQPTGQTCAVSNGSGAIPGGNIESVSVNCTNTPDPVTLSVSGIEDEGITVQLWSSDSEETLDIDTNGSHSFDLEIAISNEYSLEISSQPQEKYCLFVQNGETYLSGTAAFATPIALTIVCEDPQYQVSGTLSGLIGEGIRIQFNGIEILNGENTGSFSFDALLHQNESFQIGVIEQPSDAYCIIDNGNGSIEGADISNVVIDCVASPYRLSGTLNNLNGTLLLDGYSSGSHNTSERIVLTAEDTSFEFSNTYPGSDTYHLDIPRQPAGQLCTIDQGEDGDFSNGDVTNIVINCVTDDTPPDVVSVSPTVVLAGEEVQIFGHYIDGATITLDGAPLTPTLQGREQIAFIAPDMEPGGHTLTVTTGAGSHTSTLNYGAEQTGAIAVDGGSGYSCLLINDGTVKCFGYNGHGRLGQGDFDLPEEQTSTPQLVTGLSDATAISVGSTHACALTSSGAAYCWGANENGELGNQGSEDSASPVQVTGFTASVISSGAGYTCAVEQGTGDVYCWGYNGWGQLGDGTTESRQEPTKVNDLTGVVMVSANELHTCALVGSPGSIYCWGENNDGRLGNGTTASSYSPVQVTGITNAISVATGYMHTCALLQTGEVRCWGSNHYLQLGDPELDDEYSSVPLTVGNTATEGVSGLVAKAMHTCYITSDLQADCWGTNHDATLGDNTALDSAAPTRVHALTDIAAIGLGYSHSCAVLTNGHARCWGEDGSSELGTGGPIHRKPFEFGEPIASTFNALGDVAHLSIHADHACAVVSGHIYCMGKNDRGQLGNGTQLNSTTPVEVTGISNATHVYTGRKHACALRSSGSVACWGANDEGQLGNGENIGESSVPVSVSTLSNVVSLSAGYKHNCAARADGTAFCWGDNRHGGLGTGLMGGTRNTPAQVQGLSNVVEIGASRANNASCALLETGSVFCWGSNEGSELGNDSYLNSALPIAVQNLSDVETLIVGGADASDYDEDFETLPTTVCAIRSNGDLYCWGSGHEGQFGYGPGNGFHNDPIRIPLMQGVTSASIGASLLCAILADQSMSCWGRNDNGQLGLGSVMYIEATPTAVPGVTDMVQVMAGKNMTCAINADQEVYCWGRNTSGQMGSGLANPTWSVRVMLPPG